MRPRRGVWPLSEIALDANLARAPTHARDSWHGASGLGRPHPERCDGFTVKGAPPVVERCDSEVALRVTVYCGALFAMEPGHRCRTE